MDSTTNDGDTPLLYAARHGRDKCIVMLVCCSRIGEYIEGSGNGVEGFAQPLAAYSLGSFHMALNVGERIKVAQQLCKRQWPMDIPELQRYWYWSS